MTAHWTDEQLSDWLAGDGESASEAEAEERLRECELCRLEAEQLRTTVVQLASAIRTEAARSQPPLRMPALMRPSFVLSRWAVAAALLLIGSALLISTPTPRRSYVAQPDTHAVRQDSSALRQDNDSDNDLLLQQITADVQRDIPIALEPATVIVAERNQFAENSAQPSQGENQSQ